MSGLSVIIEDTKSHPCCPHGPTLLFQTVDQGKPRKYYACSACRDRKLCSIFVWQDEANTYRKRYWENKIAQQKSNINQRNLYLTFTNVLQMSTSERMYCTDCNAFQLLKYQKNHSEHEHVTGMSDETLQHPSKFLKPLDDSKKEAQYLFSDESCKFIVDSIIKLGYKYILCIGAPRIHEYVVNNCALKLDSLLMDFDKRYLAFYSPLQFVWYNMFNHHFFLDASKEIYEEFLSNSKNDKLIIVTDPPFGGRIEPLAATFKAINKDCQKITKSSTDLPMFWAFPYFMEPQMKNAMSKFAMLDYKVDYDNHPLFSSGPRGRKQGSPVRIFTNISLSLIPLPESEGYKHCKKCKRWVSEENKHCDKCKDCTSKDGRTYVHCLLCKRCVKPTWVHCAKCSKCCLPEHSCEKLPFKQECFNCKETGHKKSECPLKAKNATNAPTTTTVEKPGKKKRSLSESASGELQFDQVNKGHKKAKIALDASSESRPEKKKRSVSESASDNIQLIPDAQKKVKSPLKGDKKLKKGPVKNAQSKPEKQRDLSKRSSENGQIKQVDKQTQDKPIKSPLKKAMKVKKVPKASESIPLKKGSLSPRPSENLQVKQEKMKLKKNQNPLKKAKKIKTSPAASGKTKPNKKKRKLVK